MSRQRKSQRDTKNWRKDDTEHLNGQFRRNARVSANHLLNFSLPERERPHYAPRKKNQSATIRTQTEFLHANCRFVISPIPSTKSPCATIEELTEWNRVEQVLYWSNGNDVSPLHCPICLDAFQIPKITKCGHVFCWSCILRYLSLSERYWRRCPMCFDSVQIAQLRSVRFHTVEYPPAIGSNVHFQFLQRPKSSLFPQLRGCHGLQTTSNRPVGLPYVNDLSSKYSRVIEATLLYLKDLVETEIRDLLQLEIDFRSSGDTENLPFIQQAIKLSSERLEDIHLADISKDEEKYIKEDIPISEAEVYSFYQISNGSTVILHPLNMKCLLRDSQRQIDIIQQSNTESDTFSAMHYLSDEIEGKVLHIERHIMDEIGQKRYRFVSHFPKFADFYVCELDLSSILSQETQEEFAKELKKRAKQRAIEQQQKEMKAQKELKEAVANAMSKSHSEPLFAIQAETLSLWPLASQSTDDTNVLIETVNPLSAELLEVHENGMDYETYTQNESSYANVTRNSGYFPPLNDTSFPPVSSPDASMNAWHGSPSISEENTWSGKKGKKKGAKGTQLFSTTHRRSYR